MIKLYQAPNNGHIIYQVDNNYPLVYCIYVDHKDYIAKDRDDGLVYIRGFKTKQEAWDYYKEHCQI